MKTILLVSFLVFAISITLPSTIAQPVYDTDFHQVLNGGNYHIVPVFRGRGGGLELGITGNETCPLSVVQAHSELSLGLPAKLSSRTFSLYINEGMRIRINFTRAPHCVPKPSQWEAVEEFPIGWSVKHTDEGIPEYFTRERYDKYGPLDYKLLYYRHGVCADLGIHNRLLVVRDGDPFVVNFRKATQDSAKWNINA